MRERKKERYARDEMILGLIEEIIPFVI